MPTLRSLSALLALLFFLITRQSVCAVESFSFRHLTLEDGLSHETVQSIVQDSDGFIWVGSQHGLSRYDGFGFRHFFLEDVFDQSRGSRLNSWIWSLLVDHDGRLWVGTEGGGLAVKAPEQEHFQEVPYDRSHRPEATPPAIRALAQDRDGNIWVGTEGAGLTRLSASGQLIDRYLRLSATSTENTRVSALHVDEDGTLWVGTMAQGLYRFDPANDQFEAVAADVLGNRHVRSIVSNSQRVWAGTLENGLFTLNASDGAVLRKQTNRSEMAILSNSIRALLVDEDAALWIGHDSKGIDRQYADGRISSIRAKGELPLSIKDDHISALYQDANGIIWIGTNLGISRWNPHTAIYENFSDTGSPSLSEAYVASIAPGEANQVWVGTRGAGVNLLDLNKRVVRNLHHDPADPNSLGDDRVFSLARDGDVLWVGTRAGGLSRYDMLTDEWTHYRHERGNPNTLSNDGVTSILAHSNGSLWVGTWGGGLNRMDRTTGTFERINAPDNDRQSACSDQVLSLIETRNGMIWMGTYGDGICRLNPTTGEISQWRHDSLNTNSLPNDFAWTLTEDLQGNIWVASADSGIALMRAEDRSENHRFHNYTVRDGLISNVAYSIVTDHRGDVWIGSNKGLSRLELNPDTNRLHIRHLKQADGILGKDFSFAAAQVAADGRLFFGSSTGLTSFYPEALRIESFDTIVNLTGAYLADGTALPWPAGKTLSLKYDQPVITFEYAAMDFAAPESIHYEHLLEGFDQNWIDDGNRNRTTYTNLPSGTYRFRVRASNDDGMKSPNELTLLFDVVPPPWQSRWAYAFYALLALMLILLSVQAWRRRMAVAHHIAQVNDSLRMEIASRQANESALEQERAATQRYLDIAEVMLIALDRDGRITMINKKGQSVLGVDEQSALQQNFVDTFVPENQQGYARACLSEPGSYSYAEWHIRDTSGKQRLIAWHNIQLPDDRQNPGGTLISGTDVTQLRNLESQLQEAKKMEALGTLARGVAHDFNNILSAILGYSELAEIAIEKSSPARENLHKISQSIDRARDLIQRVLTFGRAAEPNLQQVSVSQAAEEAIQLIHPVLPQNVRLETELNRNGDMVIADPSQLIQIILNLCTNGAQSMAERGGRLCVKTRNIELDTSAAAAISLNRAGKYARISVIDDGPGMDSYTRSRIFEPFFTTREQGQGSGLGLAVAHGIVGSLNGTIQVESAPGQGARFDVYLPVVKQTAGKSRNSAESETPQTQGTEHILFVDDESAIAAIAQRALGNKGYTVTTAANGQEALAILESQESRIDAVVTDQTMPGMLGEELARVIKLNNRDLPIVLISGADHPQGPHIDGYLAKPFTSDQLSSAIRKAIDHQRAS